MKKKHRYIYTLPTGIESIWAVWWYYLPAWSPHEAEFIFEVLLAQLNKNTVSVAINHPSDLSTGGQPKSH